MTFAKRMSDARETILLGSESDVDAVLGRRYPETDYSTPRSHHDTDSAALYSDEPQQVSVKQVLCNVYSAFERYKCVFADVDRDAMLLRRWESVLQDGRPMYRSHHSCVVACEKLEKLYVHMQKDLSETHAKLRESNIIDLDPASFHTMDHILTQLTIETANMSSLSSLFSQKKRRATFDVVNNSLCKSDKTFNEWCVSIAAALVQFSKTVQYIIVQFKASTLKTLQSEAARFTASSSKLWSHVRYCVNEWLRTHASVTSEFAKDVRSLDTSTQKWGFVSDISLMPSTASHETHLRTTLQAYLTKYKALQSAHRVTTSTTLNEAIKSVHRTVHKQTSTAFSDIGQVIAGGCMDEKASVTRTMDTLHAVFDISASALIKVSPKTSFVAKQLESVVLQFTRVKKMSTYIISQTQALRMSVINAISLNAVHAMNATFVLATREFIHTKQTLSKFV